VEGDHNFTIEIVSTSISSPVVMIGTPSQQTATIQDNDGKPLPKNIQILNYLCFRSYVLQLLLLEFNK